MKKYLLVLFAVLLCIGGLTGCSEEAEFEHRKTDVKKSAERFKLYDDDEHILTKADAAIWLVKIANCINEGEYDFSRPDKEKRTVLFAQAISDEIIAGPYPDNYDGEKNAAREEVFNMIDRALMIYEISNQYNIAEGYLDFEETSDWARDSVAKITAVIYRSRQKDMLNRGICPESSVTQGEMGKIINTVVDSEYFYMKPEELDRYIKRIVMTGINIYTVVLGGTGILVISVGIKLYTRFCTKKRVKKEIIYVGAASTGKTELSSVLGHIHRVRRSFPYSPTRGTNEAESVIVKNPYGKKEELLSAIAKDISGDSDEALTGILSKGNFFGRNKIIILLLAHNKGNMEKDIDREYIDIQADKLKKVYLPDIRVFSKKIDRVVVFVNKCDTLPDIYKEDYEKAKEILYKEHFELLNENMPENVDLYVCFGSAKTGIGLDKLRDSLWQN